MRSKINAAGLLPGNGLLGYLPWLLLSLLALAMPGVFMVAAPRRLRIAPVLAREEYALQQLSELGLLRAQRLGLQALPRATASRAAAQFVSGDADVLLGSLHEIMDLVHSGVELRILLVHACARSGLGLAHDLRVMAVSPETLQTRASQCQRLIQAWMQLAQHPQASLPHGALPCSLLGRRANTVLLLQHGGGRLGSLLASAWPGAALSVAQAAQMYATQPLERAIAE